MTTFPSSLQHFPIARDPNLEPSPVPKEVDGLRPSAAVEQEVVVVEDTSDESDGGEMEEEEEEEEIPLDMEDVEAVSKKARQDEDLGTEHLQVETPPPLLLSTSSTPHLWGNGVYSKGSSYNNGFIVGIGSRVQF